MNKLSVSDKHNQHEMFKGALNAIKRTYRATMEGIADAQRMRRAYDELRSMSDHELEDIGLTRGDIPALVAGTYDRDGSALPRGRNVIQIARRDRPRSPGTVTHLSGRRSKQMSDQAKAGGVREVDVRRLAPPQRHVKIFELVNKLGPGGSFVLVNDHDPKPLYYQLEAEYPKQFSWTYIERGPQVWRVEIGKLAQAA